MRRFEVNALYTRVCYEIEVILERKKLTKTIYFHASKYVKGEHTYRRL